MGKRLTHGTIYKDYERIVSFMGDSTFTGLFHEYATSIPLVTSSLQDINFLNLSNYLTSDSRFFVQNYGEFMDFIGGLSREPLRMLMYSLFRSGESIFSPGGELLTCDIVSLCGTSLGKILQRLVENPNFFILCSHVFTPPLPMALQVKLLHGVHHPTLYGEIGMVLSSLLKKLISPLKGKDFFELLAISEIESKLQGELLSILMDISLDSTVPFIWAVELSSTLKNFMCEQYDRLKAINLSQINGAETI